MNHQEMNLNIRLDPNTEMWDSIIPEIYREMDGWLGFGTEETKGRINLPHWFSFDEKEKHICASVEAGGIHFSGLMEDEEWENWKKKIKKIATENFGFSIGEIELGEG
ncbi:MAG: hypothetical protein AAF587_25175 [Bacteroidota bacterium]